MTRLWDAHSCSEISIIGTPVAPIRALAYSPDGRLAIAAESLGFYSRDARKGHIVGNFEHNPIRALAYSPDGTRVATGNDDGAVTLRDSAGGAELQVLVASVSLGDEPSIQSTSDRYGQEPVGRDFYTMIDGVGYDAYAEAIARAIQHKDTKPPLTIGIKGSWAPGKTSLMRMVQGRLEWSADVHPGDHQQKLRPICLTAEARRLTFLREPSSAATGTDRVQNRTVLRALKTLPESQDDQLIIEADPRPLPDDESDMAGWRPTVWFNPWMYQTGEQVWAGLAYEIIKQITGRMSVTEREHFWLRLNVKRVDEQAVRRKIYGIVLDRLLPYAIAALIVIVIGLTLLFTSIPRWVTTLLAGGPPAAITLVAVIQIIRVLHTRVSGSVAQLVRPAAEAGQLTTESGHGVYSDVVKSPDYGSKTGFFYLVRADVQRVLDLVATDQRPVVVFIDDLDRCSPGTVVQVIEAINLFLAGEYPNAIFVAAMEPEMVAAHIQAAYSGLAEALDRSAVTEEDGPNLGWRFLEKFVQLPLTLPAMEPDRTRRYFASLFPNAVTDPGKQEPRPTTTGPEEAQAGLQEQVAVGTQLGEAVAMSQAISETSQTVPARIAIAEALRQVIDRQLSIDNDEVREIIAQATPWLAANPREMKRFVNVFRFLVMIDSERGFQQLPSTGDLNAIAKLAVLHIRWPELVAVLAKPCPAPGERSVYELLEESDPTGDQEAVLKDLIQVLGNSGLGSQTKRITAPDLRRFIASDPKIGPVARNYL